MLKLTFMNNILPPIKTHSRSSVEDLRGVGTGGTSQISSSSKQPQTHRQQQPIGQHRRNPLRSDRLIAPTGSKYVTTTTAIGPAISSPFVSVPSLTRSSSIVQTKSSAQIEPAKINYRSSDNVWNDHASKTNTSNQQLHSNSPIKSKLSTSVRHSTNETTTEKSTVQIPSLSSSSQQHLRDDMNNDDLLLSTTTKSHHPIRRRHTNSFLDKSLGTTDYSSLMRKDSYRSSLVNNSIRPTQISIKERNYVNSKTSFYEVNEKDFHLNGTPDENIPLQQQQMNSFPNTQRLYGSTFDLTANRKPFSPNKSRSFNIPANTTGQHDPYSSKQELPNNDRNDLAHFPLRSTTSKEQTVPTTTTTSIVSHIPGERHPSAQSYESRDPNKSYAYTDVKKYIEENALMSPETEQTIKNWIIDVEKHRHLLQKIE